MNTEQTPEPLTDDNLLREPAAPFTDDDLRRIAGIASIGTPPPHETAHAIATELLAARVEIAALKLRLEPVDSPNFEALITELGIDMTDPQEVLAEKVVQQRERIRELEAERPPRFSQRQFMQATRDRDEAQTRAAELVEHCADFINQRVEYVNACRNANADHDYYRWQGGAEARRQLAQRLGWTVPYESGDKTTPKSEESADA
jgi:hypothetical protein